MGLDWAPHRNNGESYPNGNWEIAQRYYWLRVPTSDREETEYPPNPRQYLVPMAGEFEYACQYPCILHRNVVSLNKASISPGDNLFISLKTVILKAVSNWEEAEYPPNPWQCLVPMVGKYKYACRYACILHRNVVSRDKASVSSGNNSFLSLKTVLKMKYATFLTEQSGWLRPTKSRDYTLILPGTVDYSDQRGKRHKKDCATLQTHYGNKSLM